MRNNYISTTQGDRFKIKRDFSLRTSQVRNNKKNHLVRQVTRKKESEMRNNDISHLLLITLNVFKII